MQTFEEERMKSVADILGPWSDPDFSSGLIERCKKAWTKPIEELTNEELATFLRQEIAIDHILPEAKRRIKMKIDDDSEMFEGELSELVSKL